MLGGGVFLYSHMQHSYYGNYLVLTCLLPAQTRLTAARAKAEAVVGQEDLSERGKAREIEKLYAKARAGKGAKKAKPSRSAQHANKTKGKPLDGRLRADKRQVSILLLLY